MKKIEIHFNFYCKVFYYDCIKIESLYDNKESFVFPNEWFYGRLIN